MTKVIRIDQTIESMFLQHLQQGKVVYIEDLGYFMVTYPETEINSEIIPAKRGWLYVVTTSGFWLDNTTGMTFEQYEKLLEKEKIEVVRYPAILFSDEEKTILADKNNTYFGIVSFVKDTNTNKTRKRFLPNRVLRTLTSNCPPTFSFNIYAFISQNFSLAR